MIRAQTLWNWRWWPTFYPCTLTYVQSVAYGFGVRWGKWDVQVYVSEVAKS